MARLGFGKLSATSEILAMGLTGMVIAAFEDPISTTSEELLIVSGLSLPPDAFSSFQETLVRFLLISLVLMRNLTVHLYIIACMILWWPLLLEEHPALVLPWLVVSGIRNILADFIAFFTGSALCISYGCLSVTCIEFLAVKGITLAWSVYLYVSVYTLYLDLRRAPTIPFYSTVFSKISSQTGLRRASISEEKRLEMAVRRRMCRSMADEHELRMRLMESMAADDEAEVRQALSLEEVQESSLPKMNTRLRSLDTLIDRIGTDWDQMSYLIERREDERHWATLESKAKAFLMLSTNEITSAITEANRRKRLLQRDQVVQTDMLDLSHMTCLPPAGRARARSLHPTGSWHLQVEASRQLLGPAAYMFRVGSQSNNALKVVPSHQLHSIVSRQLQATNKNALQHFRDQAHRTSLDCMSNKRGRRDLSPLSYIVVPPRFGYQHACTQVNILTMAFIQQQIIEAAERKEEEALQDFYEDVMYNDHLREDISAQSLWTKMGSVSSTTILRFQQGSRNLSLENGVGIQADLDAVQSLAAVKMRKGLVDNSVGSQTDKDIQQSLAEIIKLNKSKRAEDRGQSGRYQSDVVKAPTEKTDTDGGSVSNLIVADPKPKLNTRNAKIQTDLDRTEALAQVARSRGYLDDDVSSGASADDERREEHASKRAKEAEIHKQVMDYLKDSQTQVLECTLTPPDVSPTGSWNSNKSTLPNIAKTSMRYKRSIKDESEEDDDSSDDQDFQKTSGAGRWESLQVVKAVLEGILMDVAIQAGSDDDDIVDDIVDDIDDDTEDPTE